MAIGFKQLKSPLLAPTSKLTAGKLSGCRICDVWDDHYEYLIWLEKAGYVKYQLDVVKTLQHKAGFAAQAEYYANEVKPWVDDDLMARERRMVRSILDDDVPY